MRLLAMLNVGIVAIVASGTRIFPSTKLRIQVNKGVSNSRVSAVRRVVIVSPDLSRLPR